MNDVTVLTAREFDDLIVHRNNSAPHYFGYVGKVQIMKMISFARIVGKAERTLLYALILRADYDSYVTTASYVELERETMLTHFTLKLAARSIEQRGLISRGATGPRPNTFTINVGAITAAAVAEGRR